MDFKFLAEAISDDDLSADEIIVENVTDTDDVTDNETEDDETEEIKTTALMFSGTQKIQLYQWTKDLE